jgi:hypothetical protein
LPYPTLSSQSSAPLELIFSDVWGPAIDSFGGKKYYVSFIDNFSKFTWIYLLHRKSEVFKYFHEFQQLVECMFNRKILSVQTDWGDEYVKLNSFHIVGINHLVSCPHSHQQNGAAECKHRHIVVMGLSLLSTTSMPLKYWDEAFLAAIYLINRTPTKVLNYESPIHRLLGAKPDYSHLHIFGCACWPNLRPYNFHKLQFRSIRCVFLGYSNMHKGFKCLDTSTWRIYISRDVVFDEKFFPFANLHPRAGSHYTSDVLLIPHSLLCGSTTDFLAGDLHPATNNFGSVLPATQDFSQMIRSAESSSSVAPCSDARSHADRPTEIGMRSAPNCSVAGGSPPSTDSHAFPAEPAPDAPSRLVGEQSVPSASGLAVSSSVSAPSALQQLPTPQTRLQPRIRKPKYSRMALCDMGLSLKLVNLLLYQMH